MNLINEMGKGLKNYKKIFWNGLLIFSLFSGTAVHAYQNNFQIVPVGPNYTYTDANIREYYLLKKADLETKELLNIVNMLLNNSKFKNTTELMEQGDVKVSTLRLLQQLKNYLGGWSKYTDTEFDNNSNKAGIVKILDDYMQDNDTDINIPTSIKNQVENSLKQLRIFQFEKEIKEDLNRLNRHRNEAPRILYDIMHKLNILIQQDINDLNALNIPEIKTLNGNLKERLIEEYRIYAKTTLLKSLKIFKQYTEQNYRKIYYPMGHHSGETYSIHY